MKKYNSNKGITLVSLVITIVVILILAGVSIYMGTGNSGIVNTTREAKEATEEHDEKEMLQEAAVFALAKNPSGEILIEDLKSELEKRDYTVGEEGDITIKEDGDKFIITMNKSKRIYEINKQGEII